MARKKTRKVDLHDLLTLVYQLKAIGFLFRNYGDTTELKHDQAFGLGCVLDQIAHEAEEIIDVLSGG